MRHFYNLLFNNFIANLGNNFIWFALTFWVYLETRSVMYTSFVAGIFMVCNLVFVFSFGKYVDNNKKKKVMIVSSILSFAFYILASLLYLAFDINNLNDYSSMAFWSFIILLLLGTSFGNLRNIALPICVNLFFKEEDRAKGNGMIGAVGGAVFGLGSVLSGLAIGFLGMGYSLVILLVLNIFVFLHLFTVKIPESDILHLDKKENLNFKQTLFFIIGVPGLLALIFFTTLNNFLGGVFMSLMDAYGLSLVSVQTWGTMWGLLSFVFIISGISIAKFGVGKNPVRTMILLNIIVWFTCVFFAWYGSIVLFLIGVITWMFLSPFIESSENTIIQKVVPYENQGKVTGFGQTLESAATPFTAFMIGPLTELIFIPFMNNGWGATYLSFLYGKGNMAGIGLVFSLAGIIGTLFSILMLRTRAYKQLSKKF